MAVEYSFVIPVLDEEEILPELHQRLAAVMDQLDGPAEVVLVDDGSTDGSFAAMRRIHEADGRFRVVRLSRNFGHQIAITAGLEHARGQAMIIMDADLQDPPEVVPEMAKQWRAGYEVVYGVRDAREGESRTKLATARWFYRLLRPMSEIEIPVDAGDFRLVDRQVVDAVLAMPRAASLPARACSPGSATTRWACTTCAPPATRGTTKFSTAPDGALRHRRHRVVLHRAAADHPDDRLRDVGAGVRRRPSWAWW